MHKKQWDEITYPFPKLNGSAVEVWEWISNIITYFTGHVITYACITVQVVEVAAEVLRGPSITLLSSSCEHLSLANFGKNPFENTAEASIFTYFFPKIAILSINAYFQHYGIM